MKVDPFRRPVWWRAYSFVLVTAVLFLGAWFGQAVFQAQEIAEQAELHGGTASWADFWTPFLAATFENWQSEFLQLCWQAAGLAFLYHWGSSQSREAGDRLEAKVDELLARAGGQVTRAGEPVGPIRYRIGRSVGRTVYAQVGFGPSERDRLIGVFDSPALAQFAVDAMNAADGSEVGGG